MITVNYLVVVVVVTFPVVIHSQLHSDDRCNLTSTGGLGVCKRMSDCPAAIQSLRKNQKFPQICGFQGLEPVVCCTNSTDAVARITGEISKKNSTDAVAIITGEISKNKCREYSRYSSTVPPTLIIGGEPVQSSREFPHQAAIGFEQTPDNIMWLCGGTIISERFVLTAAHCLFSQEFGAAKYVRMGITNLKDYGSHNQQIKIAQRIAHPKYTSSSQYYDIGLVKLETNAVMNSFSRPACLYTKQEITARRGIATGWGSTAYAGTTSDDLLKVTLDFFSQERCNKSYKNQIGKKLKNGIVPDTQICAGSLYNEEKDTCQGDSGGPLQIHHDGDDIDFMYDIVGVTSFGKACGGNAGVYTKVSYFIKWIEDIVWPQ